MINQQPFPLPERQTNERNIEAAETSLVPPKQFSSNLSIGSATPSVFNVKVYVAANTAPQNITNFMNGYELQEIAILGDGQTTLVHGTKIMTNTGADKLLAANKVYRLTLINGVWYEDA